VEEMDKLQEKNKILRPDGKSQVTVLYKQGKPIRVEKIVLAKPFDYRNSAVEVKEMLFKKIVLPILDKYNLSPVNFDDVVLNGTGKWEIGGPASDTGVTGRKIVVDSYGGMARIGGGCFSGKDPTKVDRSAAYAARYIAKNIVANGLADRCEIQLAYVIGSPLPVAKSIDTFGTEKVGVTIINDFALNLLDLSVKGIINGLDLRRPIYQKTARYGHFGNTDYPWEKLVSKR
jgi:S-adenosylmethionine synthetase